MKFKKLSDNLFRSLNVRMKTLDDPGLENDLMALFDAPEGAGTPPAPDAPPGATVPPNTSPQPEQPVGEQPVGEQPLGEPAAPAPVAPPVQGTPDADPLAALHQNGLDKFKSVDDLAKSYKELEQYTGRTKQELSELRNQMSTIQEQLQKQQPTTGQPEAPAQQVDSGPSDEELAEMMYSDPKGYTDYVVKQALNQQSQATQAQAEDQAKWAETVNRYSESNPEIAEYAEDMAALIQEDPSLKTEKGLRQAHLMAKGMRPATAPTEPPLDINPKDFLADEHFVEENVLSNPDIKQKIIQQYLKELQNGGTPVSIGNQAVGNTPLTPRTKPTNFDEAEDMAAEYLSKF